MTSVLTNRIDELSEEPLDVLVIGGGIVGSGVARDAAMRGLRVGLAEQHDFAFGTSSRSSRLLHGGLRYLAQGRIGMVREASREKGVLHRIAPHLAEPLPFVFPSYRGSGWPLWQLRAGVKLYDLLCGGRNLGRSSSFGRQKTLEIVPGLKQPGLTGAVRYFDGLTNDARLVIDTLRSAAAHGAILLNYCRVEEAFDRGGRWECQVRDLLSDQTRKVGARAVIHATGPWAEKLPQSSVRLRLTKGVHLVIDRSSLPIPDAVVVTREERILFAIPWGERVILGTTDTDYEGQIEAVRTETVDVDYVLDIVNGAFPTADLGRDDVLCSWAGLRPLIASGKGGPSDTSRAHQIKSPRPGWVDVAGGKLTTYRLIAEQVVDRVFSRLGRKSPPCRTATETLVEPEAAHGISGIVPSEVSAGAIRHYCQNEWAVHLDDVMLRRGGWHYYRSDAGEVAREVAREMAGLLDWDTARTESELARYGEVPP
jgi:glycerol-3-phosphate dehydrogenase